VLLLDEPTTGVDPVTRQDFWRLIIRLVAPSNEISNNSKSPVAVLVSTPYMDEAMRCARVGFMKDGKMVIEGQPEALRTSLSGRILELEGNPLTSLRQMAKEDIDVEDAQMFGDRLHIRVREGKANVVISRLNEYSQLKECEINRISEASPQLEDFFIYLLEQQD